MATLYVGDLAQETTEAMLFEKFSSAGPVLSIRVCRDMITRQSLGYAYVNFTQHADAERALETMNFDLVKGRPMRIMWSQRDPSLRRSGVGNVFIKNLDVSIDNKAMYDTFSAFGNILSCKVASDLDGISKGYGFVHFETEEASNNAIKRVNGMLLHEKKVYVGTFVPRKEREKEMGEKMKRFTNVYVKNFGENLPAEKLEEVFSKFGKITSYYVKEGAADGEEGTGEDENRKKNKGFGFVSFQDSDSAQKAVEEMNGVEMFGKILYVGRAQKRAERQQELRKKFDQMKAEKARKYAGVNLYVKNLDDSIDDERLEKEFESYGTVTSARVMTENGRSKVIKCFIYFNHLTKLPLGFWLRMLFHTRGSNESCDGDEWQNYRDQAPVCGIGSKKGGQEGSLGKSVHPEDGRHASAGHATDAADGHGRLPHAGGHGSATPTASTEVLHARRTPSTSTKVAAAEHGCTLWRKSGHGHDWNADEHGWHDARHDNGKRRCSFPGSKDGAAGDGDGQTGDIHDGQAGKSGWTAIQIHTGA